MKCSSTFSSSAEYDTHNCTAIMPIENVYVSHTSTQKSSNKKPPNKKKRKVARIELSPPPVRRRVRSARSQRGVSPTPPPAIEAESDRGQDAAENLADDDNNRSIEKPAINSPK